MTPRSREPNVLGLRKDPGNTETGLCLASLANIRHRSYFRTDAHAHGGSFRHPRELSAVVRPLMEYQQIQEVTLALR